MTAQGDERETHQVGGDVLRAGDNDRLRAADNDRQWVADRLRIALNQGRLGLVEYDERLRVAYAARTYAELDALLDDLPPGSVRAVAPTADQAPAPVPAAAPRPAAKRMPTALLVLWTIWGSAVAINVVVWLMVMVGTGHAIYPWPMWVAGPSGAALLAVTIGVQEIRRNRGKG
jgi:hypothetical protein